MLKKARIAIAALFFIGITLLFIGIGHEWWGWMAKIQFLPAVMKVTAGALALNLAIVAGLILLTLIFGRIYCSTICPLGVMQDIISWLSSKRKGKRHRFSWTPEHKWLRYGIWVLFTACIVAGFQAVVAIIAPYSSYGRMVRAVIAPSGLALPIIAGVTFALIAVLAWLYGRTWCNDVCPVGTTLSFFSRFAMFRPMIDKSVCIGCRSCEKACKAACINAKESRIDYSRCVDCFNCIGSCRLGGLKYGFAWKNNDASKADEGVDSAGVDNGKRAFLAGALIAGAGTLRAQNMKVDGGLADVVPKKGPVREVRLVPFGARGEKDFYSRCTACQLCVSACPNHVLRPSNDLMHLMQPEMGYENGWCRPECTACSQVCPAGAILPTTPEEKTAEHIGRAKVNHELCILCGNCVRHCPSGALKIVKGEDNERVLTVMEERCIGCGACEFLCPSRPYSAIHVDGLSIHIKE